MSAVTTDDEYARRWADQLIERERRAGYSPTAARARVASRVKATPGTLENLTRDRLKGVRSWLYQNLLSAVVADAEREIAALQDEHRKLLALGQRNVGGALEEVEASIARLRAAMNGETAR